MNMGVLKEFRGKHSITQKRLGVALGIDPEMAQARISHYEKNRREIPTDIAYLFIDYASGLGEKFTLEDIYPRDKCGEAA